MYASGVSVNVVYIICAIYAILVVGMMIINFRKMNQKKFLPMHILGIFLIFVSPLVNARDRAYSAFNTDNLSTDA